MKISDQLDLVNQRVKALQPEFGQITAVEPMPADMGVNSKTHFKLIVGGKPVGSLKANESAGSAENERLVSAVACRLGVANARPVLKIVMDELEPFQGLDTNLIVWLPGAERLLGLSNQPAERNYQRYFNQLGQWYCVCWVLGVGDKRNAGNWVYSNDHGLACIDNAAAFELGAKEQCRLPIEWVFENIQPPVQYGVQHRHPLEAGFRLIFERYKTMRGELQALVAGKNFVLPTADEASAERALKELK